MCETPPAKLHCVNKIFIDIIICRKRSKHILYKSHIIFYELTLIFNDNKIIYIKYV